MLAVVFIFGVALLLGSATITSAQGEPAVPAATGDYSETESATYKYCIRLLRSTGTGGPGTTLAIQRCFRTVSDENIYYQASVDNQWKGLGRIFRQINFGTGDGYLRYMGDRVCSAGVRDFSQGFIPALFDEANLKSARANSTNCDDIRLWEGPNFTGTSVTCVAPDYCPDLTSFTMESLRFKD
jgi:hypothetical protein